MKIEAHFFVILALMFSFAAAGITQQEIPPGVKYKPAPESVNAAAKTKLERALANGAAFPEELFGKNLIWCGPTLWKSLKPSADKTLLEAQVLTGNLPMPDGTIVTEGRGMRNEEEKRSFWKALLAKYPSLQTGKVRKAATREISYFWATTVFDIDEPFFAIDAGPQTFVVHMGQEHGIYTFDLVGDLRDLRSSAPANVQDLQQPQKTELGDQRTAEVAHEPDSECWASPAPDKTVQAVEQTVTAGRLIHKVPPKYPKAALKAHIEGTVVLCAVIGKDGRITNLRAASGPKELVDPAIKAVQQWVYKPYLVDGEAVEVETAIRVDFELE